MKSSKQAAVGDTIARTARFQTLHRRLHTAISLGTRFHDGQGWKWKCTDIEIQRHVLRSISSFLDSITPHFSRNPLVRDSVADIVRVLVWIFEYKSQAAVSIAATVLIKFMNTIPNDILRPYLLDMVPPISSFLSGYSLQLSTSSALSLTMIFSALNVKGDHNKVWEMLAESNSVHLILSNMSSVISDADSETMENFLAMISLLTIILYWCPPTRYCVWTNVKFMHVLGIMSFRSDFSAQVAVLKLYVGIDDFHDDLLQGPLSLEKLMPIAREALKLDFLIVVRPYIWEILGWLAAHFMEGTNYDLSSHEVHINILITCACLSFVESMQKSHQMCVNDIADIIRGGSATRAVLMMVYSPSKYFESKAKLTLTKMLKPGGKGHLKHLLRYISLASSRNTFGTPDLLAVGVNLMALTCYSGLPLYQSHIVESGGTKILIAFISWCMRHKVHVKGLGLAQHDVPSQKTCCWEDKEEWEGDEMLLLCGLWGLAELMLSGCVANPDMFELMDDLENQYLSTLREICMSSRSHGLRWYSAYMLSYFGLYGFPCKLGQRIGKAMHENEYADMQVILRSGQSARVHRVMLAIRCPSLLPPQASPPGEKLMDCSPAISGQQKQQVDFCNDIYLSSHVGSEELAKLLEYVYSGYTCPGEEHVKKLKILAKHCGLQPLLVVLGRIRPKWGSPFPCYDLSLALTAAGRIFSDIILEAKESEPISWECRVCAVSASHVHAHKVVVGSSCDYLRAMFQSGMQESHSKIIKVPVGWEAMIKLVHWFYTDELPNPPIGCAWLNMGGEEKLQALQPYVELYWLSDFWFLETVQETCYRVILSRMDADAKLCIKLLDIAAKLSLWKLAEVVADHLAPAYRQLCQSGDLDMLDEGIVDMIRAASVRISRDRLEAL
ncbi:BTB/POZ domain-containing protein At1g04390 [Linum grandiflorum]